MSPKKDKPKEIHIKTSYIQTLKKKKKMSRRVMPLDRLWSHPVPGGLQDPRVWTAPLEAGLYPRHTAPPLVRSMK